MIEDTERRRRQEEEAGAEVRSQKSEVRSQDRYDTPHRGIQR